MNNVNKGVLFILAFYMAFAQPGLPACWLQAESCRVHAHLNKHHAENPHDHNYLFDLAKTNPIPALPALLVPASTLLARLLLALLLREGPATYLYTFNPCLSPDPPPPRLFSA